jgi:Fe-S-cluster containining protein
MTCDQCGLCCLYYRGTNWAHKEDLVRWFDEGRKDILQYVGISTPAGERVTADTLRREDLARIENISGWVEPGTGRELHPCPFLEKVGTNLYRCAIHATKPLTCRKFIHQDWDLFIAYRERFLAP